MEIGPNRPMSIIFLHQKYVHVPKVWPIMNTAVANTLLTQIETPNLGCFGRGSLRLWVISAKFLVRVDSTYFDGSFRPRDVSAVGRFSRGEVLSSFLHMLAWTQHLMFTQEKYQNSRRSQINM